MTEERVDFFRLVTGEDIVAEYEVIEDKIKLINPCKIVYMASEKPGFLSISLMQWVFSKITEEQVYLIPATQVLIQAETSVSMLAHYHRSVTYFRDAELSKKIDFDTPIMDDMDEVDDISDADGMDLLNEFMDKIKGQGKDKRKLN